MKRNPRTTRVLFIRHAAFGDVLMTTPFARLLREQDPDTTVDLFSQAGEGWASAGAGGRWVSMLRHPLRRVLKGGYASTFWFSYEHHPTLHPIDGYALSTGLEPTTRTLDWSVAEDDRRKAVHRLQGLKRPIIGFSPVCEHPLRSLPVPEAQAVVDRVSQACQGTVVLTGLQNLPIKGCTDFTGSLRNLQELAALMAQCDAWITVDSGPFHLAQALSVPVVGLFGCTLPELRVTRPSRAWIVRNEALSCLGCYHNLPAGAETLQACARGDLACMHGLDPGAVVQALRAALAGIPDGRLADRMTRYELDRKDRVGPWTEATCEEAIKALRARIREIERGHTALRKVERSLRRWRKRAGAFLQDLMVGQSASRGGSE